MWSHVKTYVSSKLKRISFTMSPVTDDPKDMDSDAIERLALGNVAELGSLYDARSDQFCGITILNQQPPTAAIKTTDIHSSECKFVYVDKLSDKFNKLDLPPEQSLSLLSGLVTAKGSGEYLKDEKHSARAVQVTLLHKTTTVKEELLIFSEELKNYIQLNALNHKDATHVVVGIDWGAKLIVTAQENHEENNDAREIKRCLKVELKKLAAGLMDLTEEEKSSEEFDGKPQFSLNIRSDALTDEELPQNTQGVRDLIAKLPELVQKAKNYGKGEPLQYTLLPLSKLRSHFSVNLDAPPVLKNLSEELFLCVVRLFDSISEARQKLNDLYADVTQFEQCLPDVVGEALEKMRSQMAITETQFRDNLQTLLVQVRSGVSEPLELQKLLEDYEKKPYSASNILALISAEYGPVQSRIEDFKRLKRAGVIFVPKTESSLQSKLLDYDGKDCYVLFRACRAEGNEDEVWNRNLHFYQNLMEQRKVGDENAVFLFVDLESAPHLTPQNNQETVIQHFRNGRCVSPDMLKAISSVDRGMCFVKSNSIVPNEGRQSNRANLKIRCPWSIAGICETQDQKWRCYKCKSEVEYGFDDFFYCACGRGRVETYKYRCNSELHGEEFAPFPVDGAVLKDLLGKLNPMQQLNILILGETGVGKSTWINGILNYLTYKTLEEAERGELLYAIPMSFTTTDDDYNQVKIAIGKDDNENPDTTASVTQYPKSYTFSKGDKLVRLIDTPGIGDTKGIDQDKINFERILAHLSYIDEIHGICILLKPNDARLTVIFRFCIKELLTFIGTPARTLSFVSPTPGPGETLPSLKALLTEMKEKSGVDIVINKNTHYPMDNEAIRFLAALKHGITFDDTERANFAASWEKSVAETARLIAHIQSLPPHVTQSTLSLNEIRRMIMELTRPLAEIGKNIRENICVKHDKEDEISRIDMKTADLEKVLKIPVVHLLTIPLESPRTVCASPKCVEKVRGIHNIYHTVYSQVCHGRCSRKVSMETTNCQELQKCMMMHNLGEQSYCKVCGCSWSSHMHQNYALKKVDDFEENKEILAKLGKEKGVKAQAEVLKAKLAENIKQLEEEEQIVIKVSAKFAVFLKENAMAAYNDATADYLDHLIAVEKEHVALGKGQQVLEALQKRKAAHEYEKRTLEDRLENAGGAKEISLEKIYEEINTLRNLPISGPTVQKMMEDVQNANKAASSYSEVSLDGILAKLLPDAGAARYKGRKKRGLWSYLSLW